MGLKHWKIPTTDKKMVNRLMNDYDISECVAEILVNRNITSMAHAREFINNDMEFEDPFLIKDMDKAVERIKTALDEFEKIAVYGDYDCDGVCSTVILSSYLESQGADVMYYIPNREKEGYGMNKDAVKFLAEQGVNLIITVDNGISAVEEIALANNLGMEVIITDHHQVSDFLPDAFAIVNPHRKDCPSNFKHLCGAGVAFKLVTALENSDYEYTFSQFADILSIATVADIVPLVGENRSIVKLGINAMKKTDNFGIMALIETAKIKVDTLSSINIAFGLAPRINAAGRMDSAEIAVQLLTSEDIEDARVLANKIEVLNTQRKAEEAQITTDIKDEVVKSPATLYSRVLVFSHENWHHGVIGIASSKVLEMFGKPNILLSSDGEHMRGSARSLGEFSIHKALMHAQEHLIQFGGHKLAAGMLLSSDKLADFKDSLEEYAQSSNKIMPVYSFNVDKVMTNSDLSIENIKSLDVLKPFGAENQEPIFLVQNAIITDIVPVSQNKHVRIKVNFNGTPIQAMMFNTSTDDFPFEKEKSVDFVCLININLYNDNEYLSIIIKDIHPSQFSQKGFFLALNYYQMFKRGEALAESITQKAIPSRDEIAIIYKFLKKSSGYSGDIDLLFTKFISYNINYFKFRVILDILSEANLIELSPLLDRISLIDVGGKVDLQSTDTFKKISQGI